METIIPLFAAVSGQSLINSLIYLICVGVVFGLLWWLIQYIGLPEPFGKIARVILAIAAVIFLINLIMGMAGHPIFNWN